MRSPGHFGMTSPLEVARAIHFKEISLEALAQLSPVVYEQAAVDDAARSILERVADEVAVLAGHGSQAARSGWRGCRRRHRRRPHARCARWMIERIERRVHATAASATVGSPTRARSSGAAILGLDAIAASPGRHRPPPEAELQHAIGDLSQQLWADPTGSEPEYLTMAHSLYTMAISY